MACWGIGGFSVGGDGGGDGGEDGALAGDGVPLSINYLDW